MKIMHTKPAWRKEYTSYIISLFILCIGVLPYLITAFYALPAADDFSYASDVAKYGGHNLIGVFNMVKSFYLHWEGAYYVVITGGGIDPMRRIGFLGINLSLFLFMIISILVLGLVVYTFCLSNYNAKMISYFLTILVLWGCFNARVMRELLFWYVGACNYTIPLLTGLLGVICIIRSLKNSNNKFKRIFYCLLGMILGFFSCGGSLQIAGCICWIYLLLCAWGILKKRYWKITLAAFGFAFLGALINAAAPGNYARQNVSYEKISVLKAGYYTFIAVINEIKYIFSQTYIPWLLLFIIILAFIFINPIKEKLYHPVLVGGIVLLSWLISTFPVCYGYANSALAERGYETLDIFIVIGLFIFINSLVNWLKLKGVSLSREMILIVGVLAVINIGYLQNSIPFSSMPGMQCWRQILSGELKNYHDEWIEVLETIENSKENIVEVPIGRQAYEADMVIMSPGMSENFEKWVNDGIATYYGKEKVRVVVQDEIENDE